MLNLSGTDILRIVTGAASQIEARADWVDLTVSTMTPTGADRAILAAITTAATTTVVSGPGAGKLRNVQNLAITNNHASASCMVEVQQFDGTNSAEVFGCVLLAGENLIMDDAGNWHHHDGSGAEYAYTAPASRNLGEAGTLAETMPRETCPEVNTTAGATGTLFMQAIYLVTGQTVSSITAYSATTAAATTTNLFFALYDANRALLAQSANQGAYTWAANSKKTLAMSAAYKVPTSGIYYIGILQVATTIATLKGGTAKTGGQLAAAAPILHGTSTTGLTTALPNPAAAITAGTASIYAAVS